MTGPIFKNLVKETSTSGGSGTLALAGAVLGSQRVAVIGEGNTGFFSIREVSALGVPTGPWEVSNCTYTAGTLVRNAVEESSNGGLLIPFATGTTKIIELVQSAAQIAAVFAAVVPAPTPPAPPPPPPAPTPPPPAPAPASVDTRPRFFVAPANAYSTGTQAALNAATPLTGSTNAGRAGTFSLTTTTGNYGWLAVLASASTSGVRIFDGVGYGGWSGAGLAGNNGGNSPDPTTSTTLFTDANGTQWRLFRQDYINANPSAATYTMS